MFVTFFPVLCLFAAVPAPTPPPAPSGFTYDYQFMECFPHDVWYEMLEHHPEPAEGFEGEEGWEINRLTVAEFNSLTLRQRISYFSYPEEFSQNCDAGEVEDSPRMAIPVWLGDSQADGDNSQRQIEALQEKRDSVLLLLSECGSANNRYTDVMKRILIEVNGWELIPDLISAYDALPIKESSYLTTLLRFMSDANYKPFKQSAIGKLVEDGQWEIPYTTANETLLISLARQYHAEKKKGSK